MASMMMAAALMAVISGWVRPWLGRIGTPVTGFVLMATGFWTVAHAVHLPMAMLGTALIGSGLGFCMPTFITTALNAAPAKRRGLVSGLVTSSFFLGQFLSPIVMQPVITYWNYRTAFTFGAGSFAVLALILAVTLKRRPPPTVDSPARAH